MNRHIAIIVWEGYTNIRAKHEPTSQISANSDNHHRKLGVPITGPEEHEQTEEHNRVGEDSHFGHNANHTESGDEVGEHKWLRHSERERSGNKQAGKVIRIGSNPTGDGVVWRAEDGLNDTMIVFRARTHNEKGRKERGN